MAKRSDFAQKLLDDLRLRKQRMASSQTSHQSHHFPIDAYAYTKQAYRGSRNTKANEIVTSRTGVTLNSSSRSHRSVNNGQVSNQMVPYGKGQSSRLTGDMSLALAFALENGGKLKRSDSIMGFLHQINRGTLEFSVPERQVASTSNYPIQINEISKGAHKLNQILRACTNGLNMDTYSIQFAKELLQGAIDLEESLRMLVDLQNNSQFMITSQKKNRITLLEEDNDDNDDTGMEMQLTRSTFSFDKHTTQNTQQIGKATFMQRPISLTSSKEDSNSNNENKTVTRQVSQKRSTKTSSISTSGIKNVNANSEGKNQTASNPEKGRIPNVIAKLMGLDILPDRGEMDSKHVMLQKREGISPKHTAKGRTKKTELQRKETDNLVPIKEQKDIEAFKTPATKGEEMMSGANTNFLVEKTSSGLSLQNGKPLLRDQDGIKTLKEFDKQTKSSAEKNLTRDGQNYVQGIIKKKDHPNNNNREHKGTIRGRTDYPVLNNMLSQLEQVKERSEVKPSIQPEKVVNANNVQPEKRHTNKNITNNEKKSRNNNGIQKTHVVSKNGLHEEKHRREQLQVKEEQMLMMRPQGGSEISSKNSPKSPPSQKKQLSMNQGFKKNSGEKNVAAMKSEGLLTNHYNLVRDEASNYTNEKVKEIVHRKSGQISSPRDQEYERAKRRSGLRTLMDEKHVYKLASKKIRNTKKQNVDVIGKIDQVLTGRKGAKLITKPRKQQIPTSDKFEVLNEAEQERISLFRETDAHIISPSEQVYVDATEPLDVKRQPHKESELPPTFSSSVGGELQSQQDLVVTVPSDLHCQDVLSLQDPVAADERFVTGEVALQKTNGILEDRLRVKHSNLEDQNICEKSFQQPLTESENCLKWILVMSQLFVNTAEGLFKLNIPFNVLQGGGREIQDEGSKLILDCGYEVMKRKGIRQELKRVHSYSRISMGTTNIISFDELVRQLNKDMEKIKFYGRKTRCQVDVEDYLPKMLEHDVYDKDPDVNCMWDLGWNDETVAFIEKYDVIRDTEKNILSVLLDEITLDFCTFNHTPIQ
ncbi:hypothetical protein LR48_Vigan05g095700 [Vigna angularis]|uniref:DUF3741 domain-containing protein n=1 Tax=Phaseolus angularis TaxID=3914 RepID=A0A0L9UKR4_PHAAN|nr:hypothetical protein LR48_Vigan05g095700 [Vigna angularis]